VDGCSASHLEIQPHEIVRFLLAESGQDKRDAVNVSDILKLLRLEYLSFDFDSALPEGARTGGKNPRALLSFPDRVVATHSRLIPVRERFSILHEVAHYVLPNHRYRLFLCDDAALAGNSNLVLENEASVVAADLLFQGDRFTLEANSQPITAATVKLLADKYNASYEATARRLAEKSLRPCMFLSFRREEADESRINLDAKPIWHIRYCVGSPTFVARYYARAQGTMDPSEAAVLTQPGRDIAESITTEVPIKGPAGEDWRFVGEFFFNQYNIFGFLTPVDRTP
jgi:hypothetical protein